MKFDAAKLEKDIESLEGICDDGKKGIKKLFENHFGVEFKELKPKLKSGEVWQVSGVSGTKAHVLVLTRNCTVNIKALHGVTLMGNTIGFVSNSILNDSNYRDLKFLASSIEEYFKKKFAKEL